MVSNIKGKIQVITVAQRRCVAFEVISESRYFSQGEPLNKNWWRIRVSRIDTMIVNR